MNQTPNTDDIDFLVKQTLALTEKLRDGQYDGQYEQKDLFPAEPMQLASFFEQRMKEQVEPLSVEAQSDVVETEDEFENEIPSGPGLVYGIDIGVSTFCIRLLATENISETCVEIGEGDKEILSKLKLEENDLDEYELQFYEVECFEIAECIASNLSNKRFPIYEERLCNLSDPGFSWWLENHPNGFKIHYKSRGFSNDENLIKLGPLGNPDKCSLIMSENAMNFHQLFSMKEFSISNKSFTVFTNQEDSEYFKELKNLFIKGEFSQDFNYYLAEKFSFELYQVLVEIAANRRFWLEVEQALKR